MMENEKAPRSIRLATLFSIVLAVVLLLAVARITTWAFAPNEVLVVNNSPVPVQPPEVTDGGQIFLTIDFCKKLKASGSTEVNLIGETAGAKIAVAWPTDNTEPQCTVFKDVPVPIPAQTPTDTYHTEFLVCYDVNRIKRNRCTTFTSQSFKVINSKLNPGDAKVRPQ